MSKINCRMNEFCNSFQYHCRPFVDIHYFVSEIIVLTSLICVLNVIPNFFNKN